MATQKGHWNLKEDKLTVEFYVYNLSLSCIKLYNNSLIMFLASLVFKI